MNRCRHNPPCQRREYWGRGGAGVLFTCSEDGTVLLLLRAAWVEQGGTWGIPGGGIGEGFYRTPVQPITDMRVFLEKAKEEVEEECGSLPPGVRSLRADLPFTEYEDCGFRYVTFILDITRAQKGAWAPFSADGENDAFVWFPLDAVKKGRPLPDEDGDEHDIHFGVTFTMGKLPRANPRPTTAERTDPALWEAVKREVTAGSKGGVAGEWSARKAQLSVALYKQRGGGYLGPKSPQNALAKWTREDWRTRSGKPSLVTGERYLPARAIEALTPAEYAATTRAKRAGMRKGQQFVPQPERIAAKAARYRKNPTLPRGFLLVTLAQARNMTGHRVADLSPRYSHAVVNSWGGFVSAGVTPEAAVSLALARVGSLDDLARNGTLALDTVVYHGERAVAPWRDGYTMYVSTDKEYAKDYGDVVATPLRSLLGMGIFLGPDEDNVGGDVAPDALSMPAERSRREWYMDYEAGTGKPSLGWWTRTPTNGFTLTGDLASARKVFAPVRANPARRAGDKRYRRNPSPREAEALRAIRANLTPDLLAGEYRACAGQHPMAGHCSVATEALYFTLGGKTAGYTPMNVRHPVKGNARGVSHWYLRTPDNRYLDPTADQFDTPVDYASGRGRGFPTPRQGHAEPPPSKRAATLLSRIGARKR